MTVIEQIEERRNNFLNELEHPRFHSEEKGCDIERISLNTGNLGRIDNIICKTHNVTCSKSGWELGYYLGQRSKDVYDASARSQKYLKCECGKRYRNDLGMCKYCYNKAHPELFYDKKLKVAKYRLFVGKRMNLMRNGLSYHIATEQARLWAEEEIKKVDVKEL